MNQDRVPINEVGTRDEDEGAAPQAAHRQGLVIQPCASTYSDIHFFFDEIDRAIGGDDLHPDQRVVCQEAGHDPRKRVLGKAGGATDPDYADRIRSQQGEVVFGRLKFREDRLAPGVIGTAYLGEPHGAGGPLQQAHAKPILQPTDMTADA